MREKKKITIPGGSVCRSHIISITQVRRPSIVPEILISGLPEDDTLESFRARHAAIVGSAPPYWVIAWPGGQALARYILDKSDVVYGRRVLDLGCGSGVCAIAAALAGAADVIAADGDALALCAVQVNASMNDVTLSTLASDFEQITEWAEVICAGDLWYDRTTGRQASAALTRMATRGSRVLFGDALRPGRPRTGAIELARYPLNVSGEFGRDGQKFATVSELRKVP